jgi:hypothetical protein
MPQDVEGVVARREARTDQMKKNDFAKEECGENRFMARARQALRGAAEALSARNHGQVDC